MNTSVVCLAAAGVIEESGTCPALDAFESLDSGARISLPTMVWKRLFSFWNIPLVPLVESDDLFMLGPVASSIFLLPWQ